MGNGNSGSNVRGSSEGAGLGKGVDGGKQSSAYAPDNNYKKNN